MHRPADPGHIAIVVSQIAATPDEPAERAAALLEPLHRLLPFDGAWLALRDEKRRGHHSLVSTGWDRAPPLTWMDRSWSTRSNNSG
jgi:hypothetical protein